MKLSKANKRDKKRHKLRYGMRVDDAARRLAFMKKYLAERYKPDLCNCGAQEHCHKCTCCPNVNYKGRKVRFKFH